MGERSQARSPVKKTRKEQDTSSQVAGMSSGDIDESGDSDVEWSSDEDDSTQDTLEGDDSQNNRKRRGRSESGTRSRSSSVSSGSNTPDGVGRRSRSSSISEDAKSGNLSYEELVTRARSHSVSSDSDTERRIKHGLRRSPSVGSPSTSRHNTPPLSTTSPRESTSLPIAIVTPLSAAENRPLVSPASETLDASPNTRELRAPGDPLPEDVWAGRAAGRQRSHAFYARGLPPPAVTDPMAPLPPQILAAMQPRAQIVVTQPVVDYATQPLPEKSSSGVVRPVTGSVSKWQRKQQQQQSHSKCVRSPSSRFWVGYAETIGRRPTMEDQLVVVGNFRGHDNEDYFGLFDGHGGIDSATYSAAELADLLAERLQKSSNPVRSLREAFHDAHQVIAEKAIRGGTTAVVALFIGEQGFVANVGDSRAVLYRHGETLRVSLDHKPNDAKEQERIKGLGGNVTCTTNSNGTSTYRVMGQLAVSRSLGDTALHPYVSCDPEITGPINLTPDKGQFMILACDGLWDVMSDEDAANLVASIADPEQAAVKLRDQAFKRGSTDNISVIVVRFPPHPPEHFPEETKSQEGSLDSSTEGSDSGNSSGGSSSNVSRRSSHKKEKEKEKEREKEKEQEGKVTD